MRCVCVSVFPSKSPAPSELGQDERDAVLGGDITLKGVAALIRSRRVKNIVVVCGEQLLTVCVCVGRACLTRPPPLQARGSVSLQASPTFAPLALVRAPVLRFYVTPCECACVCACDALDKHSCLLFSPTGLYDNLAKYELPKPTAVFDLAFFAENPRPFFHLARELYPGRFTPTPTHYFLKMLSDKGLLRRVYTQNVDTLERLADVPGEALVEVRACVCECACDCVRELVVEVCVCGCTRETRDVCVCVPLAGPRLLRDCDLP